VRSARPWRLAVGLWLCFGFITWNGVFDHNIRMASRHYLDAQQAFLLGRGPRVFVIPVMEQAISAGFWSATAWAALAAGPGLAALAWLGRDARRRVS